MRLKSHALCHNRHALYTARARYADTHENMALDHSSVGFAALRELHDAQSGHSGLATISLGNLEPYLPPETAASNDPRISTTGA